MSDLESTEDLGPFELPPPPQELLALLGAAIEPSASPSDALIGTLVTAEVVELDAEFAYVKFGSEQFGRCPISDAAVPGTRTLPEIGASVPAYVEEVLDEGRWRVSLGKGALLARLDALGAKMKSGEKVRGRINLVTKGGFVVESENFRSYLPGRESGIPFGRAYDFVGEEFDFQVREIDREEARPVLSRATLLADERRAARTSAAAALEEGAVVEGTVSSIKPYGVFISLGEVDALCHVSELSLQHVDNPASVVAVGDVLLVKILEINKETGKIGVSRREVLAAEQKEKIEGLGLGEIMEGTVTRIADFGAFIELRPGIEGLCHISELSWTSRPKHPSEIVEVGQSVRVKLLDVSSENGRIALSLRQIAANPWLSLTETTPAGTIVDGTITRIEDYGIFVKLPSGVEGLAHISDLAWEGRPKKPAEVRNFEIGESLTVKVLAIDAEKGRVSLGLKQLTPDPWEMAADKLQVGAVFKATVTRFDDNSAYLAVAPGLEGRMHVSEISADRVESLRAALRIGQEVEVMTLAADSARRRIDLSAKAVLARLEQDMPKSFADDATGMNSLGAAFTRLGMAAAEPKKSEAATEGEAKTEPSEN